MSSQIQAVLFEKNLYNHNDAKEWLKRNKFKFISYRLTSKYRRYRIIEPNYNKYIYRIQHKANGIAFILQLPK